MLKEGRGQGEFEQYMPWIFVRNVSSIGWKNRVPGVKIDRQHHLLSRLEHDYFHMAEFCPTVIDIKEQYPLPRGNTNLIAETLGISHPYDSQTGVKTVLTTDFLLTMKIGNKVFNLARTIKQAKDLENYRVIEKFEIERRYWKEHKTSWGIVTDEEINKYEVFARNIINAREYYSLDNVEGLETFLPQRVKSITEKFKERIIGCNVVINEVAGQFEAEQDLGGGVGLAIFKHLIYHRQIGIDLYSSDIKLSLDTPQNIEPLYKSLMEVII